MRQGWRTTRAGPPHIRIGPESGLHDEFSACVEQAVEAGPNPEYAWPGEMVRVDVKKLGRSPDGGGHRSRTVKSEANSRAVGLAEGRRTK